MRLRPVCTFILLVELLPGVSFAQHSEEAIRIGIVAVADTRLSNQDRVEISTLLAAHPCSTVWAAEVAMSKQRGSALSLLPSSSSSLIFTVLHSGTATLAGRWRACEEDAERQISLLQDNASVEPGRAVSAPSAIAEMLRVLQDRASSEKVRACALSAIINFTVAAHLGREAGLHLSQVDQSVIQGLERSRLALDLDAPAEAGDADPKEWSREMEEERLTCKGKVTEADSCLVTESLRRNKTGGIRLAYLLHYNLPR